MICEECHGKGYVKLFRHARMTCLECGGSGIASCCDAAGSCAMPASDLVKKTDVEEHEPAACEIPRETTGL